MIEFYVGEPRLCNYGPGALTYWLANEEDFVAFGNDAVFDVPDLPKEQSLITPEGEMPYVV
jgi:hypothetical protein